MGCEKDSAEHLRSAERAWDEFAAAQDCAPAPGEYSSVDDVKRFAASMTRSRKRAGLAQRDSVDEPARQGGGRTSTTNWLRQVCSRAWRSGGGQCAGGREGWLGCRERRGRADGARALRCRGSSGSGRTPVQSRVLRCALALLSIC